MQTAILDEISQIIKDFGLAFSEQSAHVLMVFACRLEAMAQRLTTVGLVGRHIAANFSTRAANFGYPLLSLHSRACCKGLQRYCHKKRP